MHPKVQRDLDLLRTGLDALGEAALHGNVTVVVIDEVGGPLTGDLSALIHKMQVALGEVHEFIEKK